MKKPFFEASIFVALIIVLVALCAGNTASAARLQATAAPTMAATQSTTTSPTVDAMMKRAAAKATGDPIPVGLIFDLTGPTSALGKQYSAGELGFIDWLNNHGGIDGRPIKPFSADFAYNVSQAQQLYTQYTTQDKVVAFMGWGTGDTESLRSQISDDQMPFMSASYSASLNDPSGQAPYNFLVGTTYSDQAVIMLGYLIKQYSGTPKVAFVYNDSPFGTSPLDDAEAFLKSQNIDSIRIPMPNGATDFTPQIAQVKQFGATHVLFQNIPVAPAAFVNQATDQGLKVVYACLNYCADEIMVALTKQNAEGIYGAIPFAPPTLDIPGIAFVRQYTQSAGIDLDVQGLSYVQGFWTMAVMVEGIRRTLDAGQDLTGPNIKAALEGIKDFDTGGVTPPITFTPSDHRGNRAIRIYQVQKGKWIAVTDYIPVPNTQ